MFETSLKTPEAAQHIGAVLRDNDSLYDDVRLRCAATRHGDGWRSALWIAQTWRKGEAPERTASIKYEGVLLLEEWLSPARLPEFVKAIETGCISVDGQDVDIELPPSGLLKQFLPSNGDYGERPGTLFWFRPSSRPGFVSQMLLDFENPFFPGVSEAATYWSGLRDLKGHSDQRLGSGLIFLPECRTRFLGIGVRASKVRFSIERVKEAPLDLRVKGQFDRGEERTPFQADITRSYVRVPVPDNAESMWAFLVGRDGAVHDWHWEGDNWLYGTGRVLAPGPLVSTEDEALRADLASGEGDRVEFKPFLELKRGERKILEVVRTVIAFANTHGGDILFGVDDGCSPVGTEADLHRLDEDEVEPNEGEHVRDRYARRLRQLLAQDIAPSIELEARWHDVDDRVVLRLVVSEGKRKPYYRTPQNDIYVRRGANNIRPDPQTELPRLFPRPRRSFLGGLDYQDLT